MAKPLRATPTANEEADGVLGYTAGSGVSEGCSA